MNAGARVDGKGIPGSGQMEWLTVQNATTRLTVLAHDLLRSALGRGDVAVDATAGNGHDTVFLAECVGPEGKVLAIDIQPAAIERTKEQLAGKGLADRVVCCVGDHAEIAEQARSCGLESFRAAVFNLGYLPGGDHGWITRPASTIAALDATASVLSPSGALAITCYRGHAGGEEEYRSVLAWFERARALFTCIRAFAPPDRQSPPLLIFAEGKGTEVRRG